MRVTYRYAETDPPAPVARVRVIRPDTNPIAIERPALVDTGADRTVVPLAVAQQVGAPEVGLLPFAGLGGQVSELPIYLVLLSIRDLPPVLVEVAASDGEADVILGRDIFNGYRLTLDGPAGLLTITDD